MSSLLSAQSRVREHKRRMPSTSPERTYEDFIRLGLSEGTISHIEKLTRGQSDNERWFDLRQGVVTASLFKRIVKGTETLLRGKGNPEGLLGEVFKTESGYASPAMKWGKDHELQALDKYWDGLCDICRQNMDFHKRPGLFLSKINPLVGATPDAVLYSTEGNSSKVVGLIEVKCPFNARGLDPEDAALKDGCIEGPGGSLEVKTNHPWYFQTQAQMGILGVNRCDLVVYTLRGVSVVNIDFDPEFFQEMMSKVGLFIQKYLYPRLYENC